MWLSDVYIIVKGIFKVIGQGANDVAKQADRNNKNVVFKNCASFTDCISEIIHK